MMSATASLGLILLWDVDGGLTKIDKYFYSSEDFIKAGAFLACGVVSSGVRNECDPALALLTEFCLHKVMVSYNTHEFVILIDHWQTAKFVLMDDCCGIADFQMF